MLLLGHENDAKAAFPDLLQELVRSDNHAGTLRERPLVGHANQGGCKAFHEAAGLLVSFPELLNLGAESRVAGTGTVQVRRPLRGIVNLQQRKEDGSFAHCPTLPAALHWGRHLYKRNLRLDHANFLFFFPW
jgi:hypothetical protein